MQTQRPIGVTLLVIWSFFAGIIAAASGQDIFRTGLRALASAQGYLQLNPAISEYQTMVIVGAVLLAGGLLYRVGAIGLFQGREWGRKVNIVAAIAVSLGWIGLTERGSAIFSDPLDPMAGLITTDPALGLFTVLSILSILYLLTDQVRVYLTGGE